MSQRTYQILFLQQAQELLFTFVQLGDAEVVDQVQFIGHCGGHELAPDAETDAQAQAEHEALVGRHCLGSPGRQWKTNKQRFHYFPHVIPQFLRVCEKSPGE